MEVWEYLGRHHYLRKILLINVCSRFSEGKRVSRDACTVLYIVSFPSLRVAESHLYVMRACRACIYDELAVSRCIPPRKATLYSFVIQRINRSKAATLWWEGSGDETTPPLARPQTPPLRRRVRRSIFWVKGAATEKPPTEQLPFLVRRPGFVLYTGWLRILT